MRQLLGDVPARVRVALCACWSAVCVGARRAGLPCRDFRRMRRRRRHPLAHPAPRPPTTPPAPAYMPALSGRRLSSDVAPAAACRRDERLYCEHQPRCAPARPHLRPRLLITSDTIQPLRGRLRGRRPTVNPTRLSSRRDCEASLPKWSRFRGAQILRLHGREQQRGQRSAAPLVWGCLPSGAAHPADASAPTHAPAVAATAATEAATTAAKAAAAAAKATTTATTDTKSALPLTAPPLTASTPTTLTAANAASSAPALATPTAIAAAPAANSPNAMRRHV